MSVFELPDQALDEKPWPTLGPDVCAWMEANLAFGPGDLRGRPYRLDDEDRALVYRIYEVSPPDHPGHCEFDPVTQRCTRGRGRCGRRRFNSAMLMLRKGMKKSERAGAVTAAELAGDAPVRCDGFRREGGVLVPVGRPVTDPYIPLVAYSEKQAEDTAFASLYVMLSEGPAADHFDIGLARIMRARGDGKAEALATAPDSRDGGRTTFQVKEEPHRWTLPRQIEAHHTMTANLAKRPIADPWELYVTTAYAPGEGSLAEMIHASAQKAAGQDDGGRSSRLFLFYRWAADGKPAYPGAVADPEIDIATPDGLLEAIDDASGPVARTWSDPERIASQFTAAGADLRYLERTWLNRVMKSGAAAFDVERWRELGDPRHEVPAEALVVLSFHGARYWDAAALVATEIATGYQWPLGIWERPPEVRGDWEVPSDEVDVAVANAFDQLAAWKFYVNRDRWESNAANWARIYGEDRVVGWNASSPTFMGRAVRAFENAITVGEVSHPGDRNHVSRRLTAHIGAAHRRELSQIVLDDDGRRLWVIAKERPDSPHPINAAQAAIIGWQARIDALREGAEQPIVWTAV